jgi:hypothetical protein
MACESFPVQSDELVRCSPLGPKLGDERTTDAGETAGEGKCVNATEINANGRKNRDMKDGLKIVAKLDTVFSFESDTAVADIEDANFCFSADELSVSMGASERNALGSATLGSVRGARGGDGFSDGSRFRRDSFSSLLNLRSTRGY